jgi:hypothetical protein
VIKEIDDLIEDSDDDEADDLSDHGNQVWGGGGYTTFIHFLDNSAAFCIKNANFFADFLAKIFFKIITSWTDVMIFKILSPKKLAFFCVQNTANY